MAPCKMTPTPLVLVFALLPLSRAVLLVSAPVPNGEIRVPDAALNAAGNILVYRATDQQFRFAVKTTGVLVDGRRAATANYTALRHSSVVDMAFVGGVPYFCSTAHDIPVDRDLVAIDAAGSTTKCNALSTWGSKLYMQSADGRVHTYGQVLGAGWQRTGDSTDVYPLAVAGTFAAGPGKTPGVKQVTIVTVEADNHVFASHRRHHLCWEHQRGDPRLPGRPHGCHRAYCNARRTCVSK
jgi:hypothetical protein